MMNLLIKDVTGNQDLKDDKKGNNYETKCNLYSFKN